MKIFVTVGTTKFTELVKAIDKIAVELPTVNFTVQIGYSNYEPKNVKFFDYTDKINHYLNDSDLIITHGGAGTVYKLLELKRRIIVVANPNVKANHQVEIVKFVNNNNYAIGLSDLNLLKNAIQTISEKKFNSYSNDNESLINDIYNKIKNTLN